MSSNKVLFYRKFQYCFFTRNGGVSKKEYESLNCAFNAGDNSKNVQKNRKHAKNKISKKKKLILMNQIHSKKIIVVNKKNNRVLDADGIISNREDLILGVLTADCAPIIFLGNNYFGIIHAGWKGTFLGIIEEAINIFIKKGESKRDISVFIGPHLQKKSFEVKVDFIKNFEKSKFDSDKYISIINNLYFFDFSLFLKDKIVKEGLNNFTISTVDTFKNPQNFFSYRYYLKKGIKKCGRQISLVSIKDNYENSFG